MYSDDDEDALEEDDVEELDEESDDCSFGTLNKAMSSGSGSSYIREEMSYILHFL